MAGRGEGGGGESKGEVLDTVSHEDMVEKMLAAKNDRKRAESDVQLLANRLAHLKAEQRKAEKKIQETEKRAVDIRKMKARNADAARRKEVTRSLGSKEQQKNQQFLAMERAKQREMKKDQRLKVQEGKRVGVKGQKQEKLRNMKAIEQNLQDAKEKNRKMKLLIKQREEELRLRRAQEEERRRRRQQEEYKRRYLEEKAKQDEADAQIADMEAEEMKLIEQLRKTQERQRAAYEKLESALTTEGMSARK